jgi:hypothetical protein
MKSIIDMAREAGIDDPESDWMFWNAMERFAALVRADERENFFTPEEARVALEDTDFTWHQVVTQEMVEKLEAIRARGETK